ncbi:hypothetical protein C9374_014422 [Naegleria lovaniensis]|uniref:Adenylate and Guanylate cyclase catalytic domain containing protein n=1 Tax=Naegleria lovaniensis TaxID=51637 RepID=A0AA88KU79_NAELO|nr:uncharacterized protein C9374_014422 [Naegleria lovaniensis]KAG2389022.1 hypothetical protein C9374_014422 [Naegleria lovaniensis]
MTSTQQRPSNEDMADMDTLSGATSPQQPQVATIAQQHLTSIPKSVASESLALTGTSNASSDSIGANGSLSKKLRDKMFSFLVSLNPKQATITSWRMALFSIFQNCLVLYMSVVLSSLPSTLKEEEKTKPLWGIIPAWIHRVMFYPITLGAEHYSYTVVTVLSALFLGLELLTLCLYALFYLLHSKGNKYSDKIKTLIRPITLFMLMFTNWMVWIHCIPMSSSAVSSSSEGAHALPRNEYFPTVIMTSTLNIIFMVIGSVGVILNMMVVGLGVVLSEETVPPTHTSLSLFGTFSLDTGVAIYILNQVCVVLNVLLHVNNVVAVSVVKFVLSLLLACYFLYRLPYYKTFTNSVVFGCLCGKTLGCLGPIIVSAIWTSRGTVQLLQQEEEQTYISQLGGIFTGVTLGLQCLGIIVGTVSCELYLRFGVLNVVKKVISQHLTDKHSAIQIYNSFQENKSMRKLILFLRLSISDSFSSKHDNALEWSLQFLRLCGTSKTFTNVDFLLIGAIITSFYSPQEEVYSSHSLALSMLLHARKNNPSLLQSYFIALRSKEIESNMEKFSMMNVDLKQTLQSLQKKQQAIIYFHKELFKELISETCSKTKIENLNRSSAKLVQDCDSMYKTLMLKYRHDPSLLRSYAHFLEKFMWEKEMANELLEEVNDAPVVNGEEDTSRKLMSYHPTNMKTLGIPSRISWRGNNRVHPSSTGSSFRSNHIGVNSPNVIAATNSVNDKAIDETIAEEPMTDENWDSVSVDEESLKKENLFRSATNSREDDHWFKSFFSIFMFFSLLVVALIFSASMGVTQQLSVRISLEEQVCSLSGIPHLILTHIRTSQTKFRLSKTPEEIQEVPQVHEKATAQLVSLLEKVAHVKSASESGAFIPEVVTTFTEVKWPSMIPIKQSDEEAIPIYEQGVSSISAFVDNVLNQGEEIVEVMRSGDFITFNKTRSNYPLLFFYLNRREMTTAFDYLCTSYISSSNNDIDRIGNILFGVCGSVLGLYFIFCLFYIVMMRNHLLQFNRLVKFLYNTLPKDETGKIYHNLEKEMTDPFRENSSRLTPAIVFTLLTLLIIVLVLASSICIMMEFDTNRQKTASTMKTINLFNTVMRTSMRVVFRLLEMVQKSKLMLISWNVVRGDNTIELANCMIAWKEIVVGGNETNYKSAVRGLSAEIDSLLLGNSLTTCQQLLNHTNSTLNGTTTMLSNVTTGRTLTQLEQTYDCMGMDKLVTLFVEAATEYNFDFFAEFYEPQKALQLYFGEIYFLAVSLSEKLFTFISTYVKREQQPQLIMSVCSFVLFVILGSLCMIWSFSSLTSYWYEKYYMRRMLNYLHWEIVDQNEELKQFILSHKIPKSKQTLAHVQSLRNLTDRLGLSNFIFFNETSSESSTCSWSDTSSQEDPMSMTKSIMNAAADGAIVCNAQGNVIIFNKAAEDMFGYKQNEVVGTLLLDLLYHPESNSKLQKIISEMTVAKNAFSELLEITCSRKNRTTFSAVVSLSVSFFNRKPIIACFVKDITNEKKQTTLIAEEKKKSEELLLNILPLPVAIRLKQGEASICEKFNDVTVFFSDMVGFTSMSSAMSPNELIILLNDIVHNFDRLTEKYYIDKIKTIGDAYFCVAGAHASKASDHTERMVKFAIDIFDFLHTFNKEKGKQINVRIGIHTGECVGGVIGHKKFAYDLWGDTINTASRMESTSIPGRIQLSRSSYERVWESFQFEEREAVYVKGKGEMKCYLLHQKHHLPALCENHDINSNECVDQGESEKLTKELIESTKLQ